MNFKLIGDSCSDLDPAQKADRRISLVPLTLCIGDYQIGDDDTFNQKDFIQKMKTMPEAAKTACPSPEAFKRSYEGEEEAVFVVTLSEHLSGTYQSAVLGKKLFEEEYGQEAKKIFVLSSHSASAGQNCLLRELIHLCRQNLSFEEICEEITEARDKMKTYFVLENLENLRKNGRLTGLAAFFATTLNIKPVMGAKDGKIIKLDQARGINKALNRMVEIVLRNIGDGGEKKTAVITECAAPERAGLVAEALKSSGRFKDVFITEAAGVATIYAGEGGIVLGIL